MRAKYALSVLVISFFMTITSLSAKDLAVTIYNDNLALVREVREMEFAKGIQEYKFDNVAALIDPTSVHFNLSGKNNSINLLEQNYEFDLVGSQRLLEKYIDEQIVATTEDGSSYMGTLLSAQGNDVIIKTSDGQVKLLKASAVQTIQFPSLPGGLITRPTLVWLINSDKSAKNDAEISYLTNGISWHTEYVAVVNNTDTGMDLSGWVSIDNNSGATFDNAKIKLVAGDVNIVQPPAPRMMLAKAAYADEAMGAQFEEKSFFEYHLYTLQRPATIKDRQIKQLSLFPPATAKVKKSYTYNGNNDGDKVRVSIEVKNSKVNGLGMPLPKGKIRVYKNDTDQSQEFIGEDQIDHTPADEDIRIFLGNAFDIVGERTVKDTKKISKNSRQDVVEVQLRNHKKEAVTITVVENFWGDWDFVGVTPKILKKTANKVEFEITVPADSEKTFEYTVLYKY